MNKKAKTMLLSLGLVGVVGAGATLAYFSDETATVNNTFTFGKGYGDNGLQLKERKVVNNEGKWELDPTGGYDDDGKIEYDGLYPGQEVAKQPEIILDASVKSHVFVAINPNSKVTISDPDFSEKWTKAVVSTDDGRDIYYYSEGGEEKLAKAQETITIFNSVKVDSSLNGDEELGDLNIQVAAIQSDMSFNDALTQAKTMFDTPEGN